MGGNSGGIFGGGQGISMPGTINNQNNYTPSQGFVNQGTPAPDPIIAGPEAAPTPVATQGVQSSFGATTNATQQPTQPQNPFTGGLGGYGYRYGDPGQQQMQQPQPPQQSMQEISLELPPELQINPIQPQCIAPPMHQPQVFVHPPQVFAQPQVMPQIMQEQLQAVMHHR